MKTKQTQTGLTEWYSIESMYDDSKEWISELEFLKDEYLFFEDLMKSYTLQLIELQDFSENKNIIDAIGNSRKVNENLIKLIRQHENRLEVLMDGIYKPEEEGIYKKAHKDLTVLHRSFLRENKVLKLSLFSLIKKIKKSEKQKRLIDIE